MKRLAILTLSLGVALTAFASAEDNNPKKAAEAPKQQHHARPAGVVKTGAHPGQGQVHTMPNAHGAQFHGNNGAKFHQNGGQAHIQNGQFVPRSNVQVNPNVGVNNANVGVNNAANQNWRANNGNHNWNGKQNWKGNGNHAWNGQQNWNGNQRHGNWDRSHHDRNWYRSHYHRFARFGGGYYYWDAGFWYPAYGYDPYFSTYSYDAPVYSYNDLEPAQVIANVQAQLQSFGYYRGSLDGTFGPMTRDALLNYQSDNGLEPTGEIDEATLDSMGLR